SSPSYRNKGKLKKLGPFRRRPKARESNPSSSTSPRQLKPGQRPLQDMTIRTSEVQKHNSEGNRRQEQANRGQHAPNVLDPAPQRPRCARNISNHKSSGQATQMRCVVYAKSGQQTHHHAP